MSDDDDRRLKVGADRANAAWERIKQDANWNDFMTCGEHLMDSRRALLVKHSLNDPNGRQWSRVFGQWLNENLPFREMGKTSRSRLISCMEHRGEIEEWRASLPAAERANYCTPSTVYRRWQNRDTLVIETEADDDELLQNLPPDEAAPVEPTPADVVQPANANASSDIETDQSQSLPEAAKPASDKKIEQPPKPETNEIHQQPETASENGEDDIVAEREPPSGYPSWVDVQDEFERNYPGKWSDTSEPVRTWLSGNFPEDDNPDHAEYKKYFEAFENLGAENLAVLYSLERNVGTDVGTALWAIGDDNDNDGMRGFVLYVLETLVKKFFKIDDETFEIEELEEAIEKFKAEREG